MPDFFEIDRAVRLIKAIIEKLQLKLDDKKVLTEAGSNYFIYTPLIAYYSGASNVYIWIKDTSYGKAIEIREAFESIIDYLNIDISHFSFAINERPVQHLNRADIITNLGFVRPIDKKFIDEMKPGSVISYMCEAWEIRPDDVDIAYCKQKGIRIAGVWENHPDLLIFNACGSLSIKLCMEANLEVYQNNILVISSDKFGKVAKEAFLALGAANVTIIHPKDINDSKLTAFDFLFVADYSYDDEIIGSNIQDKFEQLKQVAVVHLCGAVDYELLKKFGIFCYPKQQGHSFRMTKTLAHLGLKPVIDLHAAGLKVGELLFKGKESNFIQPIQ